MGILAARAARHTMIRSDSPLSNDQIRRVAPSIFAEAAHDSRSDRYQYIPTVDVLDALRSQGFQPFMAAQAKTRIAGKQEFTRHLMRLRHPDTIASTEAAHEIILLNSHDGTSSYQMLSGAFRFVCLNGLVCGDVESELRIHHKGDAKQQVLEGAFTVIENTKRDHEVIEDMRQSGMNLVQRTAFAQAALGLRFGEDANVLTTDQILTPRRHEDAGNDQWSVFNRIQENAIDGGMTGRSKNNRTRKIRPIVGMDKDTNFNRQLWQMMQALRAA